jgi:hypothetical protein
MQAKCFTLTGRTSGHCLGTFKTEDKFFPPPPNAVSHYQPLFSLCFIVTAVKTPNLTWGSPGVRNQCEDAKAKQLSCKLELVARLGKEL